MVEAFSLVVGLVGLSLLGYVLGKDPTISPVMSRSYSREGRLFPFYTIGRFANEQCTGANQMKGTCVVKGECGDGGGIPAGSCSTVTNQAVCCTYQKSCGGVTEAETTYFYNKNYPGTYPGGGRCALTVKPSESNICQIRIDFLAFSLAPPNGDGVCNTDSFTVAGGASRVPRICGENSGQHVYVDYNGEAPISINVDTTGSYSFNRQFQFQVTQIPCGSDKKAPSGCLQYNLESEGTVQSFNYVSSGNSLPNSIGVQGTRQLSSLQYGICIKMAPSQCSITWEQVSSDTYSFTMTNDVGAIDPSLLGTVDVQSQECTTDFVIIPNPNQGSGPMPSDRFCGLGLVSTTSNVKPFVLYVVHDGNEDLDIANRGFHLSYSQNACPIV